MNGIITIELIEDDEGQRMVVDNGEFSRFEAIGIFEHIKAIWSAEAVQTSLEKYAELEKKADDLIRGAGEVKK